MQTLTREQRQALWNVYEREARAFWEKHGEPPPNYPHGYRAFRKRVQPTVGCDGAVVTLVRRHVAGDRA